MSTGIAIYYGDVAPEAKENFVPTASEKEFDTLLQLQRYNVRTEYWANPCELYQTILDGSATAFPNALDNIVLGLVSKQISNDDGTFTTPIVLTLESIGQYSSQGFTLAFDTFNGIYATNVGIKWLRVVDGVTTELWNEYFAPNSAVYFCRRLIENYNKVVITFYSINMPKNRLKMRSVDYGYGTIFYGNEIRTARQIQELNPVSTDISINTFDFTLDSKSDMNYSFQEKQPLSVYFNDELISTNFVTKSTRKSRTLWDVQCDDYIGFLDYTLYNGGIYTNKNAVELIEDIFDVAKVPYNIDSALNGMTVTGYIPNCTCREALMQVAFATQTIVDTCHSNVVNVTFLHDEIDKTVPLNRIMQGQNFVDNEKITGVEVYMHSYTPSQETTDLYDATKSGTGAGIVVRFAEPIHSLSITNGSIVESGTNYAVINANSGCVLSGKRYTHETQVKTKKNNVILANEKERYFTIQNATLVSTTNIENVANKCYNWFKRASETNLRIVEGKHVVYGEPIVYGRFKYGMYKYGSKTENVITYDERVKIGDNINAETEYLGLVSGRVIKQSFNLNGNVIVKESVVR